MSEHYDLVVVVGGINRVGIAADAAGRGLKVALFEASDLASATSSNSSKLDPRRPALSRTLRIPAGERGAGGAGGPARHGSPHRPSHAFSPASSPAPAPRPG